jgi:carbonic anhydrase
MKQNLIISSCACFLIFLFQFDMIINKNEVKRGRAQIRRSKPDLYFEGWLSLSVSSSATSTNSSSTSTNNSTSTTESKINSFYNSANVNLIPSENSFYFRLNKDLIYYSELKEEIKIVDSIRIGSLDKVNDTCLRIQDSDKTRKWDLCSNDNLSYQKWNCAINKSLNKTCDDSKILEENKIQLIKKRILKQPMIIIPIPSPYCNEKWDYRSQGDDWSCDCKEGRSQSPIDIEEGTIVKFYNKSLFDFFQVGKDEDGKPLKIIYDDYTIKIKGMLGRLVSWDLIKYEAYEMQFHTQSEHKFNSKEFDLEVQIYFRAVTPGYIRKSAALSILFKVTPGSENLFFSKDINILDLPDKDEKEKELKKPIDLRRMFISEEDELFEGFSYYQYEGSLTSPPCQEETTWYVISNPLPISYTVVEYFKDVLKPLSVRNYCN